MTDLPSLLRRWDRTAALLAAAPPSATLARWGLGAMLVVAGAHKLVAPAVWAGYVVDWLAPLLVVSPTTFMLLNGPPEIAVGVGLVADRYTGVGAAVATVSLAATSAYLLVVALTQGLFWDVFARDVGLTGLAAAVLVEAVRTE
ncbi:MAG: DoxX family membrane protein [Halolamina sp.]